MPPRPNPDEWVVEKRSKLLISLTGPYPFNAEPPTDLLMNAIITPAPLHYVRNHGAVPKLSWESHTVEITGCVNSATTITMDELVKYPTCRLLVTIACDGNRRKEVNMVKRSTGFNWGPGGVSTGYWTGACLSDVLAAAGVTDTAKYVCFEGSDDIDGKTYGTSIPLSVAMDKANNVMLAYLYNDERLLPDHGYPVRVVIPGNVGGRMVKWCKKITLSPTESDNYYHLHDNRVFPPFINSLDEARDKGYTHNPEYILYEMNVNSFIVLPKHNTSLTMTTPHADIDICGIAYAGGGRRVRRVEVSIDEGAIWIMCERKFSENFGLPSSPYCWCFWSCHVPFYKLLRTKYIAVRAFDAALNTQPDNITWNVLGMMNNSIYRVAVDVEEGPVMKFRHPVVPGGHDPNPGYMEAHDVLREARDLDSKVPDVEIPVSEVKYHDKSSDCEIIIDGKVYDVTAFLGMHPGGAGPILQYAGGDATEIFHQIHSMEAFRMKEKYAIGRAIGQQSQKPRKAPRKLCAPDGNPILIHPKRWCTVTLAEKQQLSPDAWRFRFALPKPNGRVWLPCGKHIIVAARTKHERPDYLCTRPYTPVRPVLLVDEDGTLDLVIKVYFPHGKIPGGEMSMYLHNLPLGGTVEIRGPAGDIHYEGHGVFEIKGYSIYANRLSLVAGGTGITPMLQLCDVICRDATDTTQIRLVFSNNTVDDILCRNVLEDLASKHPDKLHVYHTLSLSQPPDWDQGKGFITASMLREHVFPPADETIAFICGPPAFVTKAALPILEDELMYDEDHVFEF